MAGDRIIWGYYVPIQKTCANFNMASGQGTHQTSNSGLYIILEVHGYGKFKVRNQPALQGADADWGIKQWKTYFG